MAHKQEDNEDGEKTELLNKLVLATLKYIASLLSKKNPL